jgi:nucleoside phosphorylase
MNRKKIALLFAMQQEADPILKELGLKQVQSFGDPRLPMCFYRGEFGQHLELLLSVNGRDLRFGVDAIGTEPAVLNAYVTLLQFKPDLCLNAGTAGGFKSQGAQIGDVYLSEGHFKFHDRRIPVPGWDAYGVGSYPVFRIPGLAESLGLKLGVVTTGNSLDFTERDLEMIKKNQGAVKEMEAAGIAWVASLLGVPLVALKSVTDFVDHHETAQDQFFKNLDLATQRLRDKVLGALRFMDERAHTLLSRREPLI